MEPAAPVGRPRSAARWPYLGGIIYVVLFVIGTIMLFSGSPSSGSAPAKVIKWYSDSGHRDRINVGWILIGLSLFFLLWFVSALRRSVSLVDAEGVLTGVVGLGGGIYIAVAAASVAVSDGIRTMSDDTYQHRVFPELIHAADDVGWVMHATGALGLGGRGGGGDRPRGDDHRRLARIHVGRDLAELGRVARRRRWHPLPSLDRLLSAVPLPPVDSDRLDRDVHAQHARSNSRVKRTEGRAELVLARPSTFKLRLP
jgi:hypothetical protein